MMRFLFLLLTLSVGAALAYGWMIRHPGTSAMRSATKTLAVGALALFAYGVNSPPLLVLALALSALGDLLLSRDGDRAFLGGMIAFLAAHLAYIPLFVNLGGSSLIGARWPVLAVLVLFGLAMMRVLWSGLGSFRLPVAAYMLALLAMGAAALALPLDGVNAVIPLGAALFILSDSILALEKFRLAPDAPLRRGTPFAVWALYWLAQALITFGVLW